MSGPAATPGTALPLVGNPYERGQAQAQGGVPAEEVGGTISVRLDAAKANGVIDEAARRYLHDQAVFSRQACPSAMAELSGIAAGFGLSEEDLFAHLHLGILGDMAQARRGDHDGCSAWAVGSGPDGPLVVKNRDFSGRHAGIQRVFRHEGPDLGQGPLLCIGSLGSPGAYSSGMNAAGLAVVDTQVGVRTHRTGWLRYFLMTELLARTATVADALELIRSVPHAGGGTLILADAAGALAAVELGAEATAVEQSAPVRRTNHFTTAALADETLLHRDSRIDSSSVRRRDALDQLLPGREWDAASAAALMAEHDAGDARAPICQHDEGAGTRTIASSVYCCRQRLLYAVLDFPCSGAWQSYPLSV